MKIYDTAQNIKIDRVIQEYPGIARMNFLWAGNVGWVPKGSPPAYNEDYWRSRIQTLWTRDTYERIDPRCPTLLDIEWIDHYAEDGQKLLFDIANTFWQETSGSQVFGFYRLFPAKATWSVLSDDSTALKAIKKNNAAMLKLRDGRGRWDHRGPSDRVQYTCGWSMHWVPSMDFETWKQIPLFALDQGKKYQKPCYLWMSHTYHPGRPDARNPDGLGKLIPIDLFEQSIDFLAKNECDGIITGNNGGGTLDPDNPELVPYLELLQRKAEQFKNTQYK